MKVIINIKFISNLTFSGDGNHVFILYDRWTGAVQSSSANRKYVGYG